MMSNFVGLLEEIRAAAAAVCGQDLNTSIRNTTIFTSSEDTAFATRGRSREAMHVKIERCSVLTESLQKAAAVLEAQLAHTQRSTSAISYMVESFKRHGEHAVLSATDFARVSFAAGIGLQGSTSAKMQVVNAAALGLLHVYLGPSLKRVVALAVSTDGIRLPPQVRNNRCHQETAISILELAYERQPVVTAAERSKLVEITGLGDRQVLTWFQNARHRRGNQAHGVKRRRMSPNLLIKAPKSVSTIQTVPASPSPPSEVGAYSRTWTCSPSPTPSMLYGSFSASQSPMSSQISSLDLGEQLLSFAPSPSASDESHSSAHIDLRVDPSSVFCYSAFCPTVEPTFSSEMDFYAPMTFDFGFASHWSAAGREGCQGLA